MLELIAVAMSAFGYTLLTLLCGAGVVTTVLRPLLAYVLSHQAGGLINLLVTYAVVDGSARLQVPSSSLLPLIGFVAGPTLRLSAPRSGALGLLEHQAGYYAEAIFYVLVGAGTFGWSSVWGWPLALLGLLVTVLLRPWLDLAAVAPETRGLRWLSPRGPDTK